MKSKCILAIALTLVLGSCNGQTKNGKNLSVNSNKPQSNIKVNKEYDKDGNLIRYDSTYSSYYSNVENDKNLRDSLYNNFRSNFNQKYFFSNDPFFNKSFFQDSLLQYDFYKKDFFRKRFRENMDRMDSLFSGMDLFKNEFFGNQFSMPGQLTVPKK